MSEGAYQIQKMNYRHDALIRWMLANPHRPLKEAADELGYTPTYLYMIRNSDMFRAAYEEQRRAVDGMLHFELVDKLAGLCDEWMEKVRTKMQAPVSEKFLSDIGKTLIAARYGDGSKPTQVVVAPTTNLQVQGNVIVQARERAAKLYEARPMTALPSGGESENEVEVVKVA